MKIGLATDPHYSSAEITCGKRYNSRSLQKLRQAYAYFAEERCDLVILMGDITDTEPNHEMERNNLREISALMDEYPDIPTVCLMGNHDSFTFMPDDFYAHIGESRRPRTIKTEGATLLFADACYYADGARYAPGGTDWTDTFLPHTNELRDALEAAEGKVYLFMHQNIDPNIREDHRLSNDAEVRAILEASGKVKAVYQGHYHPGCVSEVNGIGYTALPAMCENEKSYTVIEI